MKDITFEKKLIGNKITFHTTYGIFSPKELDYGSQLLIWNAGKVEEDFDILDIGCGYGPIGIALAKHAPKGSLHMVDKDFVAIEYAQKNCEANEIKNAEVYLSNGFSHVPADKKFDIIVSNIPAKIGKELLEKIFTDAHEHLKPEGRILVVTIAGLRKYIKRTFEEIFGNYTKIEQKKNYCVGMAQKK